MAQSHLPESDPQISSSDEESEEENGQEGEEGESEDESEKEKATSTPPSKLTVDKKSSSKTPDSVPSSKLQSSSPVSGSESGSESGTEPDSDSESDAPPEKVHRPPAVDSNVKPLALKSVDTSNTKKPRSKLGAANTASKSSAAAKRPAENDRDGKDTKRMKKGSDSGVGNVEDDAGKKSADDSKKPLFKRLWSEDDEIAILKGVIEYKSKKGADPSADMNAFHAFIKKSLHVDATRGQLADKIRRLKKKYEVNVEKDKVGQDKTQWKPHQHRAFDLSKKVWGGESNGPIVREGVEKQNKQNKSNGKLKSSKTGDQPHEHNDNLGPSECLGESIQLEKTLSTCGLREDVIKRGLQIIGAAEKSKLEEQWKNFQVAEVEHFLRRVELIQEQAKLILKAIKSSMN
ncbi:probable transcription factor At1g61730 [Malania oleifera]|uniref:probable transcription factor At1g61730 n=1 Tax=Malania oleifera TaxID=397392 RepID=UPI0025ADC57B|nr:probable transcription factor At1g61730 [Malania oleifera]